MNNKIPVAMPDIGTEELQMVTDAVKSGWVSSKGPFIEEFEREFAQYIGTKHGVSASNGTTALHLALTALGIGKGDKVVVPSLDFISVANVVKYVQAEPVFVDSHPDYWCMDPSKIKIDKQTKAIIAVHLYGHPCDMDQILNIAKEHNLFVIEDCAEAHGAEFKGRKVGNFGVISCFSFYGNKVITTGEGGMCLTNDAELTQKMFILRDHGMNPNKRYWHDVIGFNYRMTNIQAALGVAQLRKINSFIEKKRKIAMTYNNLLKGLPVVSLPPEMPWAKNVYWLYSILVNPQHRDSIMAYLEKNGVETRPFFYPTHLLPPYNSGLSFKVAEDLSSRGINLPSGTTLTETQVETVALSIVEALKKSSLV
jgi:perosamine synthetase